MMPCLTPENLKKEVETSEDDGSLLISFLDCDVFTNGEYVGALDELENRNPNLYVELQMAEGG